MARFVKPIDWKVVDRLLRAGCLGVEVAANFNIHHDTFYRRVEQEHGLSFTAYQAEKLAEGDSILREVQYNVAVKDKDRSLLIWLGKQRLKQKEPEAAIQVTAKSSAEKFLDLMEAEFKPPVPEVKVEEPQAAPAEPVVKKPIKRRASPSPINMKSPFYKTIKDKIPVKKKRRKASK